MKNSNNSGYGFSDGGFGDGKSYGFSSGDGFDYGYESNKYGRGYGNGYNDGYGESFGYDINYGFGDTDSWIKIGQIDDDEVFVLLHWPYMKIGNKIKSLEDWKINEY